VSLTDEAVVKNFRTTRDSQHFKVLVSRYQDRLYNVAYRILLNRHEAEEVVQETFLKVLENIGQLRGRVSFAAWLFRIAHNLCVDILRSRQRRGTAAVISFDPQSMNNGDSYEARTGAVCQVADPGLDPALKASEFEQEELISQSIQRLPDVQRSVIVLHDIEGFSYVEIAEIVGSSVGTVRSRLYYGRQKLREVLTPYFNDKQLSNVRGGDHHVG
jgi:RNA polymerase sigma-70 factor, ECF subfamily